jgi:hypothetical protein
VFSFGPGPSVPNLMVVPCNANECTAIIDTADPLLYWSARFRNSSGGTLAQTALSVMAPR